MLTVEKKVPLYHVEDEDDWQSVVEHAVKNSTNLEYIHVESSIRQLATEFRTVHGPGIAIFDLRLEGIQSELHTIVELPRLMKALNRRNFEVFILSGHLPEFGKPKLIECGIPSNHIFNKGAEFNRRRNEFIRLLQNSESRLKGIEIEDFKNNRFDDFSPIGEIEVQLNGVSESNGRIQIKVDQEYELKILAKSFFNAQKKLKEDTELQVFIYGSSFHAVPKSTTLVIPDLGDINYKTSKLRINRNVLYSDPRLLILIYHANHLIRQFTFDFEIS